MFGRLEAEVQLMIDHDVFIEKLNEPRNIFLLTFSMNDLDSDYHEWLAWRERIKNASEKIDLSSKITPERQLFLELSKLGIKFCSDVKIKTVSFFPGQETIIHFDDPNAFIPLMDLVPLAVSVINFFAKESIALTDRSFLLQPYVDILTRIDKSVLFNPPNDNILKVFCNFISKNGLDRYPIPKIDHKRYNDFSVLTTVPVLKNSRKWFFPKGMRINDLANVILATGELPKTRTEACRFYKKLKLIEPTITRNERI